MTYLIIFAGNYSINILCFNLKKLRISEISRAAMISESESAHIFRGEVEFV